MVSSDVRKELEDFARVSRDALGGTAFNVRTLPYRLTGKTYWAFQADGQEGSIRLTFREAGSSCLPFGAQTDGVGAFADSVDAHYFFEFFERELTASDFM